MDRGPDPLVVLAGLPGSYALRAASALGFAHVRDDVLHAVGVQVP